MRTTRLLCILTLVGLLAVSATAVMAQKPPKPPTGMRGFDLTIEFTPKDRAFLSKNLDRPLDRVRQNIDVPILCHNVEGLPAGDMLLEPGILGKVKNKIFEASADNPFRCWLIRPATNHSEVSLFKAHWRYQDYQVNRYTLPAGGQIQMDRVVILSHALLHPGAKLDIDADTVGPSLSSALALFRKQYNGPVEIIGQSMEKISISSE